MKPISTEKRAIIVSAKQRGESNENILKWVGDITVRSIDRIWALFQKTGSYEPKPYTGNNRKITPKQEIKILEKTLEVNDITLADLIDELQLNISENGCQNGLKSSV